MGRKKNKLKFTESNIEQVIENYMRYPCMELETQNKIELEIWQAEKREQKNGEQSR